MNNEQIKAMIAQLEKDKAVYREAVDRYNGRSVAQTQIAEICRCMTATMIDMWKAALNEEPRP